MKPVALVLDLDQTMFDTSSLAGFRKLRDWSRCKSNLGRTFPFQGLSDLIAYCSENKLKVGVVTTSPSNYAQNVMTFHKIVCDKLVAYHDVDRQRLKPCPDQMLLCAQKMGVPADQCVSLGDLSTDIRAAKAAGMISVAALWGTADKVALMNENPDFACDSIEQFIELLQKLSS